MKSLSKKQDYGWNRDRILLPGNRFVLLIPSHR